MLLSLHLTVFYANSLLIIDSLMRKQKNQIMFNNRWLCLNIN